MFIYLSKSACVRKCDIVAILDTENGGVARATCGLLSLAEKSGRLSVCASDIPRSAVVTSDGAGREKIYLSGVTAAPLGRRANSDS